jgi:hypothetical protein
MKNSLILLVFFGCFEVVYGQESFSFLPASSRLVPLCDTLYDKAYKNDMQTIITAKQALLVFMDSFETIFCEEFTSMPFVKFTLPPNLYDEENVAGSYRGKEKAIYFKPLPFGGYVQEGFKNKYQQDKFDTVAVHELGHWYHDILIGRLTGQYLGTPDSLPLLGRIEYEVIVEGIALWVVHRYFRSNDDDCDDHIQIGYFPTTCPQCWRYYGFDLVKPILDRFEKKGLEYLVLNPFKVKKKKGVAESGIRFQEQAIRQLAKE